MEPVGWTFLKLKVAYPFTFHLALYGLGIWFFLWPDVWPNRVTLQISAVTTEIRLAQFILIPAFLVTMALITYRSHTHSLWDTSVRRDELKSKIKKWEQETLKVELLTLLPGISVFYYLLSR